MFDSVRYRMYAAVDDAVIPSGLLARIILEKRDGDIAYHIDLPEPFDLRLVEDEAGCFDPAKPVGTPPVWLLVRGDEAPRPGMPCLTLAVTALDGVNESGEVHAAIIHRIDPAMGSTDEIMDSLWVRARLAARNNKPLIQAVAARLDHYGSWTGEDIRRIIDECEKELDH